jgi:hypothetical protein
MSDMLLLGTGNGPEQIVRVPEERAGSGSEP